MDRISEQQGADQAFRAEFDLIHSKPAGSRVDAETLSILRERLAGRLEQEMTDPNSNFPFGSEDYRVPDVLRSGQRFVKPKGVWFTDRLASVFDDYRLAHDERDQVNDELFEVKP